jgi:hypothetical protein
VPQKGPVGIDNLYGFCTRTAIPPELWDAEVASGQVPTQVVVESVSAACAKQSRRYGAVISTVSIRTFGESTT